MANQAIALGIRAPQVDILGGSIQRNAQVMNMMAQQAAAQRQAAKTQQEMAIAANQEARAARTSDLEYKVNAAKYFRQLGNAVGDDSTYQAWLSRVEQASPEDAAAFRAFSPTYDPDKMNRIIMEVEQYINKTTATPVASAEQDPEGNFYGVTVGGLGAPTATKVTVQPANRTPVVPAPTAAPQPPAPPSKFDQAFAEGIPAGEDAIDIAAQAIARGANISDPAIKNLTPKEFDEANLRAGRIMLEKPISFEQGGVEPLTMENAPQIVQAALDSGFIDPSHVQQLKQMLPPENQAAVDQWVQQSGLKVQPGLPGMRSAVYRPQAQDFGAPVADDGMAFGGSRMPMAQQIVNEPGTQFRGKPPMQSPTPGTVNVPIPRISQAAGAEEEGKKSAAYKAELTQSLPKAKGALKLATSQLDRDIADIDYVLRNPYREMVIGQVEGAFPSATSLVNIFRKDGQEAQNVQDRLDKINASSVVKHLQQMKEASPQGSSLFGQVTEYEDRLVAALAGLKQTQDEKTFDKALREYRNVLVEMRQNLPEVFNDTYKSVGGKAAIGAPAPAPGKTPTRSDIEYLRRNRKNPDVVNGFRKAFGTAAFNQAMGSD